MCIWMFVWLKWDCLIVLYGEEKYISACQLHKLRPSSGRTQASVFYQSDRVQSFHPTAALSVSEWEWFYCAFRSRAPFKFRPVFCDLFLWLSVWPVIWGSSWAQQQKRLECNTRGAAGKWSELQPRICVLHSSSTNHHYPQASSIYFTTFHLQ